MIPGVQRQEDKPLFPEIIWDKPVNKKAAKKLLIMSGNAKRFDSAQKLYLAAKQAGIGEAKMVLPDALQPLLRELPDCLYAPSTRSGSLDKSALADIERYAAEVDGILLGKDITANTNTVSLVEDILTQLSTPIVISSEAVCIAINSPQALFSHPQRLIVAETQTLVKLAQALGLPLEIADTTSLINKVALIKTLGEATSGQFALLGKEVLVYAESRVSVTNLETAPSEEAALAIMATWWLQHPNSFRALTTAAWQLKQPG